MHDALETGVRFSEWRNLLKVGPAFETDVSILNEFTDFSLYNLLYDKEYYIGYIKVHFGK